MKKSMIVLAISSLCASFSVLAAPTFYVGGGLGYSNYNYTDVLLPTESASDRPSFNVRVGAEWDVATKCKFGTELSYFRTASHVTNATPSIIGVTNTGVGLAGVARYSITDPVDVFVKLGFVRGYMAITSASYGNASGYGNAMQTTLGGSYHFNKNIAMTMDYSRLYTAPTIKANAYTIGAEYRF